MRTYMPRRRARVRRSSVLSARRRAVRCPAVRRGDGTREAAGDARDRVPSWTGSAGAPPARGGGRRRAARAAGGRERDRARGSADVAYYTQ